MPASRTPRIPTTSRGDIEPSPVDGTEIAPEGGAAEAVEKAQRIHPREILRVIGPGIVTGGADNDPAGVTTYSVVGAQSGYAQNWLLVLSLPLLIAIQQMSARIGNVPKTDLATTIKTHYGQKMASAAVVVTIIANIATIGADLIMMADVLQLVTGINFLDFVVPVAALMAVVTIFLDYKTVSRYLLWLAAVFACYIVSAIMARPDWLTVAKSVVVPQISLSSTYVLGSVGLLGTTITPYLFFWQTSGEVEERRGVQDIRRTNLDIATGMIWSNVTAFFMVVTTATVLHAHGKSITTAADAAQGCSRSRCGRPAPRTRAPGCSAGGAASPVTSTTPPSSTSCSVWRSCSACSWRSPASIRSRRSFTPRCSTG